MKQNNSDLTKGSIKELIKIMAIPASVGFFFNTMFNVIDTFYAGMISTVALAALSLSFPIFFIIIALGTGLSSGATAIISNHIGGKNHAEGKLYAEQAVSFGIILSVFLTISGLIFSPYLFRLLGANGDYLSLSLSYMNMIFYGTIFFIMSYIFNAILNAAGDTKSFRNFLIVGFFINIILDPILMFGWLGLPAMGVAGVALATILIQAGGTIYMGYKASKTFLYESPSLKKLIPRKAPYVGMIKQGLPSAMSMVTVGIGIFVITYFIGIFGKEAVAAYGIATRIEQLFLLPTIGLNIATLALIGQNNGAKRFDRVRETLKLTTRYGLYIMTIGTLFIILLSPYLMRIFTTDSNVINIGAHYLKYAAFMTWAYLFLFINISALQALKKPMYSLYIGLSRQIIFPLIMFPILSSYIGIDGIWISIFAITWVSAIITILFTRSKIAKLS
jgi:putative MATE family efflux protein